MNTAPDRVRSMKARRTSTCPACRQLIRVGHRIIHLGGRWLCVECAISITTGKPAPETRNAL